MIDQQTEIDGQTHRVIINIRHIMLVQAAINKITAELNRRGLVHDVTKFQEDEFLGFVKLNQADKLYGYGTPEYKAALAENNAVELHTSRHSHHPEYYHNGVNEMNLFDLIEMVCDWRAANQVYGVTTFEESLQKSMDRFGLNENQRFVVRLIAEAIVGPD